MELCFEHLYSHTMHEHVQIEDFESSGSDERLNRFLRKSVRSELNGDRNNASQIVSRSALLNTNFEILEMFSNPNDIWCYLMTLMTLAFITCSHYTFAYIQFPLMTFNYKNSLFKNILFPCFHFTSVESFLVCFTSIAYNY